MVNAMVLLALMAAAPVDPLLGGSAAQSEPREADRRTWREVMYLGGAQGVRGVSDDWGNTLTVSGTKIEMSLRDGQSFAIDHAKITSVSYRANKRASLLKGAAVGALVGLVTSFVTGGAVIGAGGATSTDHHLTILFTLPNGRPGGVRLRLHKENYEDVIRAIEELAKTKVAGRSER
jgi:hypothetical protein